MANDQAHQLVGLLIDRGRTLATVESLTGGLIGALITSVPGASAVYRGGLITYATDLKTTLSGVDEQLVAASGPVDEDVAVAMAAGGARVCGADYGLAATGVAGPTTQGGVPVGTVWLALWWRGGSATKCLHLSGDREEVREESAREALGLALAEIGRSPRE